MYVHSGALTAQEATENQSSAMNHSARKKIIFYKSDVVRCCISRFFPELYVSLHEFHVVFHAFQVPFDEFKLQPKLVKK